MINKKRQISDFIMYALIYLCASLSVVILVAIIGYVLAKGIKSVNWSFLTSVTSVLRGTVGIAGNIVNTIYIVFLTMLIATPVGVGSAIYLNEYAKPGKLVTFIGNPIDYFRIVRNDVFWSDPGIRILHSDWRPDAHTDGSASDHQKYAGGIKDRAGFLQTGCDWSGLR